MEAFEITVNTPAGACTVEVTKTSKVSEVIDQVAQQKGLDKPDALELYFDGKVLAPTSRPLVSFGIEAGAVLTLVAAGTGV